MAQFREIPLIDISALGGRDASAHRKVVENIRDAATDVGFLYVSGHGIPGEAIDRLHAAAAEFFARPLSEKMEVYIGLSHNHRGYVPEGEECFAGGTADAKEAFDLSRELSADHPRILAGDRFLGPNQWPARDDGFRSAVEGYYEAAFALGRRMLRGFSEALGLAPDHLDQFVTAPPAQLRMIHYPYDPGAEDRPGIGAHTDYEFFTLLLSRTPGLEVMNGSGHWIDAPPVPGALVINVGDMLEILSNGTFVATSHRVRKVSEERYSFPLFFSCDYSVEIAPLPDFVSPDKPPRFEPIKAGEHLFAQTAQTFEYLKTAVARGEIRLPETAHALSAFGQEAKAKGRTV